MRLVLTVGASALLLGLAQFPVLASSCTQQIGTIERRLDSAGAVHVAGLQDGHRIQQQLAEGALRSSLWRAE
jgi:hypothetical protein